MSGPTAQATPLQNPSFDLRAAVARVAVFKGSSLGGRAIGDCATGTPDNPNRRLGVKRRPPQPQDI